MKYKAHLGYWIIPLLLSSLLITFYFSGIKLLQDIVAPAVHRELGLLEHLQLVLLLISVILCFKALRKETYSILKKVFFSISILVLVFIFLEEITYGTHYLKHFGLVDPEDVDHIQGIHNRGNINRTFKMTAYIVIALFCFISPIIKHHIKNYYLRFLIPSKWIITTVLVLLIVSRTVHSLKKVLEHNQSLRSNFAEFEEFMIYYIFMAYFYELYQKRPGKEQLFRSDPN